MDIIERLKELIPKLKANKKIQPLKIESLEWELKYLESEKKQLRIGGVSKCNAKKDTNIENTILLIRRKDGLTDVYDNNGCLGKGLDTKGINKLNL